MPPGPKPTPFTPKEIQQIETMAGIGLRVVDIAHIFGISVATLYKRLKDTGLSSEVIKRGRKRGISKVAETLYKMAVSGENPAATFFYLKTRGGWRETQRIEHTGKGGKPLSFAQLAVQVVQEVKGVTVETNDAVGELGDGTKRIGPGTDDGG